MAGGGQKARLGSDRRFEREGALRDPVFELVAQRFDLADRADESVQQHQRVQAERERHHVGHPEGAGERQVALLEQVVVQAGGDHRGEARHQCDARAVAVVAHAAPDQAHRDHAEQQQQRVGEGAQQRQQADRREQRADQRQRDRRADQQRPDPARSLAAVEAEREGDEQRRRPDLRAVEQPVGDARRQQAHVGEVGVVAQRAQQRQRAEECDGGFGRAAPADQQHQPSDDRHADVERARQLAVPHGGVVGLRPQQSGRAELGRREATAHAVAHVDVDLVAADPQQLGRQVDHLGLGVVPASRILALHPHAVQEHLARGTDACERQAPGLRGQALQVEAQAVARLALGLQAALAPGVGQCHHLAGLPGATRPGRRAELGLQQPNGCRLGGVCRSRARHGCAAGEHEPEDRLSPPPPRVGCVRKERVGGSGRHGQEGARRGDGGTRA